MLLSEGINVMARVSDLKNEIILGMNIKHVPKFHITYTHHFSLKMLSNPSESHEKENNPSFLIVLVLC